MRIPKVASVPLLVLGLILLSGASPAGERGTMYQERKDEHGQTRYGYSSDNCSLSLIVSDADTVNFGVLRVRRECELNLWQMTGLVAVLLSAVKNDGRLESIETVAWGGISDPELQRRLAVAAAGSSQWVRLTEGGRRRALPKNIPEVADILNDAGVFEELIGVFRALGFRLSAKATESVLVDKARNVSALYGSSVDPEAVVPYTSLVWFRLEAEER